MADEQLVDRPPAIAVAAVQRRNQACGQLDVAAVAMNRHIQMVAYDRPFLVDTMLMSLESQGIDVHRIYNTIISVKRDEDGHLTHVDNAHESAATHMSLIHCEIAYQDNDELDALYQLLLDKVDTLDTVVGDWKEMRTRLTDIKAELSKKPLPEVFYSQQEK